MIRDSKGRREKGRRGENGTYDFRSKIKQVPKRSNYGIMIEDGINVGSWDYVLGSLF